MNIKINDFLINATKKVRENMPSGLFSFLIILFLGIASFSCNSQNSEKNKEGFTLTSFIDHQIQSLTARKVKVSKEVTIDDLEEAKTLENVNWEKELDMFKQADILKPALRNRYIENRNLNSNTFFIKTGEKLPVQRLDLAYVEGDSTQIIEIDAALIQKNYLYHSSKNLKMLLKKQSDGSLQITKYTISGTRKLIFSDETTFNIKAEVKN